MGERAMPKLSIMSIFFALMADAMWGFVYIVPNLLSDYTAIEITVGRYLVYGIFSMAILLLKTQHRKNLIDINMWKKAIVFAFCGNIGYYFFLALSIKLTGSVISTLIIGLLPITTSLYGNLTNKDISFKKLIIPILVIIGGSLLMNFASLGNSSKFNIYGIISCAFALFIWTWYAVANANFLRQTSRINPQVWSTITGAATLFLVPVFIVIIKIIMPHSFSVNRLIDFNNSTFEFWCISIILGIAVSWLGAVFWNKASVGLPVSLVGQMVVGETVFGLVYYFIFESKLPDFIELISIIIIISGVLYYMRVINNLKKEKCEVENVK
jgi:drug/metabolite transporter (DMT)-like permease